MQRMGLLSPNKSLAQIPCWPSKSLLVKPCSAWCKVAKRHGLRICGESASPVRATMCRPVLPGRRPAEVSATPNRIPGLAPALKRRHGRNPTLKALKVHRAARPCSFEGTKRKKYPPTTNGVGDARQASRRNACFSSSVGAGAGLFPMWG